MPNLSSPTLPGMPRKFWENTAEMAYLPDVSQNPVYGGFRVSRGKLQLVRPSLPLLASGEHPLPWVAVQTAGRHYVPAAAVYEQGRAA